MPTTSSTCTLAILVPSPHLADGFAVIDLPDEVRREALDAFQGADGALVVGNDRAAGLAVRAIDQVIAIGREVGAVLINLRSSKLSE